MILSAHDFFGMKIVLQIKTIKHRENKNKKENRMISHFQFTNNVYSFRYRI